jgi:hypothetical protein
MFQRERKVHLRNEGRLNTETAVVALIVIFVFGTVSLCRWAFGWP